MPRVHDPRNIPPRERGGVFVMEKPEYDLRISDWRSDVCASYLGVPQALGQPQRIAVVAFDILAFRCATAAPHQHQEGEAAVEEIARLHQIGRGSWRERVGPYV